MYRYRLHTYPKTREEYERDVALGNEYNKLAADKGWVQGAYWGVLTGEGYEVISDFDYPDLAAFQGEGEIQQGDPDFAEVIRRLDAVECTRPRRDELLEEL